jgi:hypothetical protein
LGDIGLPHKQDQTLVSQRLRDQAKLWQSRGISVDANFSKEAQHWLTHKSTLEQLKKTLKTGINLPPPTAQTYTGRVIALGVHDAQGATYLVLQDKNGRYHALPTPPSKLLKYKPGQEATLTTAPQKKQRLEQTLQQNQVAS